MQKEVDKFYYQDQFENNRTCKQNVLLLIGVCNANVRNSKEEIVVKCIVYENETKQESDINLFY